jgi:nucleotide-binding universal stress UspA family protein
VRAAVSFADRCGAELELLHVVPPVLVGPTVFAGLSAESLNHQRADQARAAVRAHLAHRHSDLRVQGKPVPERLEVAIGSPARVVLEKLRTGRYDLVFVGDSGKRKQLDVGGLARALYARADCSVWTQVEPPRPIERMLVPVDLSASSRDALSQALGVAKKLSARVHVLQCFVRPELYYGAGMDVPTGPLPYTVESLRGVEYEAFGRFVEEFDWQGVEHTVEFVDDDPARHILAAQDRFELIAMGSHGHSALAAALLGSVTWQVLRLARTPVLTIRDVQRTYAL